MIKHLNINDFLTNYWQKKPFLIRAAFPEYQSPLSAEELAGLACEDFIESRIIAEHKTSPRWVLEKGPFSESHFTTLPKTHWTLLIQGINKIFPEIDDLLHQFDFIPTWRVDDLMASYAAPGGSVGPHIDQYDVFLLQASGKRKWMISEQAVEKEDFEEGLPLKIIKNFTSETEWIAEPGDILYLPPNVAHYGIAVDDDKDDCITFSIGFRAPSHADLLTSYIDQHVTELTDDIRYTDPDLTENNNAGEISAAAINKVQDILISHINDKEKIASWFGRYMTDYLNSDDELMTNNLTTDEFLDLYQQHKVLRRPALVRANYIKQPPSGIKLYINGEHYPLESETTATAMLLCDHHRLRYDQIKTNLAEEKSVQLLCNLYNAGYLEFEDDDEQY